MKPKSNLLSPPDSGNSGLGLSRTDSDRLKGIAVFAMLFVHLCPDVFLFRRQLFFRGTACLAVFAFVSGYAHAASIVQKRSSFRGLDLFLRFYWRYLLCLVVCLVPFWGMGASLADIALTAVPLWPNRATDSWWYAAFHSAACLMVFPLVSFVSARLTERHFCFCIFTSVIACLLFPFLFESFACFRHLNAVWGAPPVLRSLLILPYYLIGWLTSVGFRTRLRLAFETIVCALSVLLCWPFGAFSPRGIESFDMGSSFVAVVALSLVVGRIPLVSHILEMVGKLSVWVWLLHMTVYAVILHVFKLVESEPGPTSSTIWIPLMTMAAVFALAVILNGISIKIPLLFSQLRVSFFQGGSRTR